MQLDLINREGKTFTRIKLSVNEWNQKRFRDMFSLLKIEKQSSRYIYFLVQGDLLNERSSNK